MNFNYLLDLVLNLNVCWQGCIVTMRNKYLFQGVLCIICILAVLGKANAESNVSVSDGYIKASIPGSDVSAAYMTIANKHDKDITLQKITSSISDQIEMHEHTMADGMMRMRKVDNIIIAANSSVKLQPSGLHLMIFSLKQQLHENDVKTLTLHFSNLTKVNIQLPVSRYK